MRTCDRESGVDRRGTLAEVYSKSRAITVDRYVAGNVLRYHPRCPWRDENTGTAISVPALIAAFHSIDDNALPAIQRVHSLPPERSSAAVCSASSTAPP